MMTKEQMFALATRTRSMLPTGGEASASAKHGNSVQVVIRRPDIGSTAVRSIENPDDDVAAIIAGMVAELAERDRNTRSAARRWDARS